MRDGLIAGVCGIIEGIFNVFPFPELRVQLHVDQCTRDGTMAEALLDLEEIRACLIVMKGMGMPEGMKGIAPALPSEFGNPVLQDLRQRSLIDM